MSNYFVSGIDLSLNFFQPLGGSQDIGYNTGYSSNGVDLRYIFLPYFVSNAAATGYRVNNNDLCNIFQKKLPFIINGLTYVQGGYNTQYPEAVNASHKLIYITNGTGTIQIVDSSKIVAMVLVGGGSGAGIKAGTGFNFLRFAGTGGEVITTSTFTNITYSMTVGGGGAGSLGGDAVGGAPGGDTVIGSTRARGGNALNNTYGQTTNGIQVSYNNLYYGGGGGNVANMNGFLGGGGGMGADGPLADDIGENLSGLTGGKGYGQLLNVFGGAGGVGSSQSSGTNGGSPSNGGGGGGGGSGAATKSGSQTGSFFSGGGGGGGSISLPGYRNFLPTGYVYSGGAGGGGAGGSNSGGGGGMPGASKIAQFGALLDYYAGGGNGGSGIIILVYTP